jgi:hypothetical protein
MPSDTGARTRIFGFEPPAFLPPPLVVLARWLAYASVVLLAGLAVLFAGGFWARHRIYKF